MSRHPSMFEICEMCGALIGDRDLHGAFHVKLHDHDTTVLAAIDEACGALEHVATLQDLDGERLAVVETQIHAFFDD